MCPLLAQVNGHGAVWCSEWTAKARGLGVWYLIVIHIGTFVLYKSSLMQNNAAVGDETAA